MLTKLGLSDEAEAVYRVMLAEPTWGVADITKQLGMSERAVRKALNALAQLALIQPAEGGRLRPVNPETGLSILLGEAEEQLRRRQAEIDSTRSAIAELATRHSDVVRLESLDAVRVRLSELADRTAKECWSFSPGGAHLPDAKSASRPVNERAVARGVELRCVYQDAFRNDPATLEYARWLTDRGSQVRTVPAVPMQMVVVDRTIAILPISIADPRAGALEVHNLSMVAATCALFESVWSSATPMGDTAARDDSGLTPHEREVLRLLASGHTDDSVARRLGLSVRTVRRTIAALTERLDATSRFQAGVTAARLGWI